MLIYCARNIDTNKMYVGKTTRTLDQRKKDHIDIAFQELSETNFHRAIRTNAKFEWTILETLNETDNINDRERFWISKLDTYKNGYNMTEGGDGGLTYKRGDILYERIKHKLGHPGNQNPGANPEIHQRAEETKLKNIQNGIFFNSGESHGNFKGNFKIIQDNYKGGLASGNSRKVQINNITYDSLRAAARAYNICAETVSNRCKSTRYLEWNFL